MLIQAATQDPIRWVMDESSRYELNGMSFSEFDAAVNGAAMKDDKFITFTTIEMRGIPYIIRSNIDTSLYFFIEKETQYGKTTNYPTSIFFHRPEDYDQKSIIWVDTTTYHGYSVKRIADSTSNGFVYRPSKVTVSPSKWGIFNLYRLRIKSKEKQLCKIDSIRQARLLCQAPDANQGCNLYRKAFVRTNPFEMVDTTPRVYILKPMIYLYPKRTTEYTIALDSSISVKSMYPKTKHNKWDVIASPEGEIIDKRTKKKYYGLFWDGGYWIPPKTDSGFLIKSERFSEVLDSLLELKGLNYREREECVTFWLEKIAAYPWVKLQFFDHSFAEQNPIKIDPTPTSFIRVFMVFTGMNSPQIFPAQNIYQYSRNGDVAVEWGGEIFIPK